MIRVLSFLLLLAWYPYAIAATLLNVSNADAVAGLKQALTDGSAVAVSQLGRENGFFGNPKVKIPLPPALRRIEGALRFAGMSKQVDELDLSMNRAAEAAVPEAKRLLLDAIRKMTVQDARGILEGGDTAATDYFRRTTQAQLTERFLPIVKRTTDRIGLSMQYNNLVGRAARFGLVSREQETVETYVTSKALDGLYLVIAEQERAIRKNPLSATSNIVRKVFGLLK